MRFIMYLRSGAIFDQPGAGTMMLQDHKTLFERGRVTGKIIFDTKINIKRISRP